MSTPSTEPGTAQPTPPVDTVNTPGRKTMRETTDRFSSRIAEIQAGSEPETQTTTDEETTDASLSAGSEETESEETESETLEATTSDDAETTEGEETWSNLQELLEAGGATDDLLVTVKVNGESLEVPIAEAVSGYQREADYRRKTQTLADDRRTFEEERVTKLHEGSQETERLAMILKAQEDGIVRRYQTIDWPKLRADNPTQFMQLEGELRRELEDLESQKANVGEIYKRQQAEMGERVTKEHTRLMAVRDDMLTNCIPKWNEQEPLVNKYLQDEFQATDPEIKQLFDPRFWIMAHKAMRYDQVLGTKTNGKADTAKATAQLKPGKTRTVIKKGRTGSGARGGASEASREASKRLRKSGKPRDAQAAFAARLAERG